MQECPAKMAFVTWPSKAATVSSKASYINAVSGTGQQRLPIGHFTGDITGTYPTFYSAVMPLPLQSQELLCPASLTSTESNAASHFSAAAAVPSVPFLREQRPRYRWHNFSIFLNDADERIPPFLLPTLTAGDFKKRAGISPVLNSATSTYVKFALFWDAPFSMCRIPIRAEMI